MTAELDPKAKRERPALKKGAAHEKRWATKAAQHCKNDSWWRLLRKRWRPKRLENPLDKAERWNRWLRA